MIQKKRSRRNLEAQPSPAFPIEIPFAVLGIDFRGRIVWANNAALRLLKYVRKDQLIGLPLANIEARKDELQWHRTLEATRDSASLVELWRLRSSDGQTIWARVRLFGQPESSLPGVTAWIEEPLPSAFAPSPNLKNEPFLHLSAIFRDLLEQEEFGVGFYSPDGTLLFLNRISSKYLRTDTAQLLGRRASEIFGGPLGETIESRIKDVMGSGVSQSFQDDVELPSGRHTFASVYTRIEMAGNVPIGVQITSHDVSELVSAHRERERSAALFQSVFERSPIAIGLFSETGTVLRANEAATRLLGYAEKDLAGREPSHLIDRKQAQTLCRYIQGIIREPAQDRVEVVSLTRPNGSTVWVEIHARVVADPGTHRHSVLIMAVDITEQRESRMRLSSLTAQLQQDRVELEKRTAALETVLSSLENERARYRGEIGKMTAKRLRALFDRIENRFDPLPQPLRGDADELIDRLEKEGLGTFKDQYKLLTPRERQICEMLKSGLSSQQIADRLTISLQTVNKHRYSVRRKLSLSNTSINLVSYLRDR